MVENAALSTNADAKLTTDKPDGIAGCVQVAKNQGRVVRCNAAPSWAEIRVAIQADQFLHAPIATRTRPQRAVIPLC